MVSYTPVMLKSMAEICKAFSVGKSAVREWVDAGAPIAVDYDSEGNPVRYCAELMRLYIWRENRKREDVINAGK